MSRLFNSFDLSSYVGREKGRGFMQHLSMKVWHQDKRRKLVHQKATGRCANVNSTLSHHRESVHTVTFLLGIHISLDTVVENHLTCPRAYIEDWGYLASMMDSHIFNFNFAAKMMGNFDRNLTVNEKLFSVNHLNHCNSIGAKEKGKTQNRI